MMKNFVFIDTAGNVYAVGVNRYKRQADALRYLLRLRVVDTASELTYIGKQKGV